MGERLIIELIGGFVTLVVAVTGLLRLVNYATSRAIRVLEEQLKTEHDDKDLLIKRVADLEAQRRLDKDALSTLQNQLTTVLNEMAALQGQVSELKTNLEAAEKTNGALTEERDAYKTKSEQLQRQLDTAAIREQALRDALALVGGERAAKSAPEPAKEPSEHADSAPVVEGTTA